MPKKKLGKISSKKRASSTKVSYSKISVVILLLLAVGVIGKAFVGSENYHVLGTSTLLAKGGSDDSGGNSGSGTSDSSDSNNGDSGSSGSNNSDLPTQAKTTKTETRTRSTSPSLSPSISDTPELENDDSGIRIKTETKPNEERTETRLSEGERIRTRTKDGQTRIDITSGGIKTRFEIKDGRVIIKAEQEDGTEVELADDTLLKIDDRLAADNIKVATAGAGRFLVQKGAAGAVTDFPISVDLATNTVFVTTPTGQKTITVLPEQAIQNLIAANIVNRLGGRAIVNEAENNNLTSVSQLITLGEKSGIPVYEINGISDQKLLGFIPVQVEKDLTVSAETGNVLSSSIPFGSRILDLLSF